MRDREKQIATVKRILTYISQYKVWVGLSQLSPEEVE